MNETTDLISIRNNVLTPSYTFWMNPADFDPEQDRNPRSCAGWKLSPSERDEVKRYYRTKKLTQR